MERLTHRDLRAILEFIRQCYAIRDLDHFPAHVISVLPKVVPSEITSYNEANPRKQRMSSLEHPLDAVNFPDCRMILDRHLPEHPLLVHFERTRADHAFKISDFLSRRKFRRLGLYNEFFRRLGVEHQMAITLPTPPPLVIGIALNRSGPDFCERERLLLNLLRPHLIQAYRNAEAVSRMQQELTAFRQVMGGLDQGVVCLTRDGRIRLQTARAQHLVAEYFGGSRRRANRLPETLRRWVRQQEALLDGKDDVPAARQPLIVERDGRRLVVRLVTEAAQDLLILEEQQTVLAPASLESLGLSRREAEVLAWVAQGKTNADIGIIIDASPRTVGKHLERIYQKLGVETRTAAAARALETARTPPGPSPDLLRLSFP